MPQAYSTMLEAALSYQDGSENRLSEIFGVTLAHHEGFARALFAEVDLDVGTATEFVVKREETVEPGSRIDLIIEAKAAGGVVAQLWAEHKGHVGSFMVDQRERYIGILESRPGQGRLLTIVPSKLREKAAANESAANDDRPQWTSLDWQQVGELAEQVGRASSRAESWEREAEAITAPLLSECFTNSFATWKWRATQCPDLWTLMMRELWCG